MRTRTAIAAAALTLVAVPSLAACAGNGGLAALTDRQQTSSGFSDDGGFSDSSGGSTASGFSDSSGGFSDGSDGFSSSSDGFSDSTGGDNLEVCDTLFTDLENISAAITSSSTPSAASSKLAPLKAKLDKDSAQGSPAVQKAVDAVNSSLTQLIKDSTAHDVAAAEADAKTYEQAFEQLSTACMS